MKRALLVLFLLPAAAAATFAQEAPPAADSPTPESLAVLARTQAASAERGETPWLEVAETWRRAFALQASPAAKAGEGLALLAFAEETLAAGEPGSAVRAAFEDARLALRKAQELGAKDVAVRIGLARCLAADGRADEQIAELRAAATDFPADTAPRRALGFALYHAWRHAEAIETLRPLSDAAPEDVNLALTLAASARAVKDEALALAAAERVVEHHPDDRRGWEAVWAVYAPEKRWAEATDRLAALAKARPGSAKGAHYAGFAAENAQRWDEALAHFERAWTLDPANQVARVRAARVHLEHRRDLAKAAALSREVLAEDPQNAEAARLLSFVAFRRSEAGDHAAAAEDAAFLAKARPDDAVVRSNLAVELRWCGRYEDSEREYLEAIRIAPEDAQAHNDLGLLYLVQGRDADARRVLLAGVEADPEAKDAAENLGWMARRDGRLDEALGWYARVHATALRRGEDGARYRRELDAVRFPLPPVPRP